MLHCSDTRPSQPFTIEHLQQSHQQRGFGPYPGYHFYVRRDGTLYYCRPLALPGCHVKGHNAHTVGICYEGGHREVELVTYATDRHGRTKRHVERYEDNRTAEQIITLHFLLATLHQLFPHASICGHRDFSPDRNHNGKIDPWEHLKACPCFDAQHEYAYLLAPPP